MRLIASDLEEDREGAGFPGEQLQLAFSVLPYFSSGYIMGIS